MFTVAVTITGFVLSKTLTADAAPTEDSVGMEATATVTEGARPRKALVIGNASYESKPLPNAINDSNVVAQMLKGGGWQVTHVDDVDAPRLVGLVEAFSVSLEPGDEALFYFSGHGHAVNGQNRLLGIDAAEDAENAIIDGPPEGSVLVTNIALKMSHRGQRAGNTILLLDACRTESPYTKDGTAPGVDISPGFVREPQSEQAETQPSMTMYIFAAKEGEPALATDRKLVRVSPFVAGLLEVVEPNKPLNDVAVRLAQNVEKRTKKKQKVSYLDLTDVMLIDLPSDPPRSSNEVAQTFISHLENIHICQKTSCDSKIRTAIEAHIDSVQKRLGTKLAGE